MKLGTRYMENKAAAVFINTKPTKTDQAGAGETDINVIIRKYGITGIVPSAPQAPMYGDFTNIPHDLAEMMQLARTAEAHRANLPEQLRGMSLEAMLALTPEQLNTILTPPEPTTETTNNEDIRNTRSTDRLPADAVRSRRRETSDGEHQRRPKQHDEADE